MDELFDANCAIGMVSQPGPAGIFGSADELVEHHERFGISRALPFHSLALEEHPVKGNAKISAATAGHDRLAPSWVALPHHTGEVPEPSDLLAEAQDAGVAAFRVFPDAHNFSIDEWSMGDFFAVAEGQLPVFWHIEKLDRFTARDIYDVCSRYPRLQVVLCDIDKSINRTITPLMRNLPNLWLETSGYRTHRGIEYLVGAVGAQRILFGTGLPWQSVGGPHAEFAYAQIDGDARTAIGSGNLVRLLAMHGK